MPPIFYKDALRQGQKEFRACTARGEHPYLPVLSDFLPTDRLNRGVDLGCIQVPAEFVVGTLTQGRTNSFARNFMPLMDEGSEFAEKWRTLCASHLEEGVRDPIKAYEYMNRYYVQEGNKRVSILKFFKVDSVYAHVLSIPPEPGTREAALYEERMAFYRCSGVNSVEFTRPGSYARLQALLGKEADARWSEEERRGFSYAFHSFREAYEAKGGARLSATAGDALLAFIQVYGYEALRGETSAQIKKQVAKAWEEIALQEEEAPIEVKLTPEEKKPGLLTKVLGGGEKKWMQVAFIHDKDPATSGWTKGHEQGRQHVQRVFGDHIKATSYFDAMDGDPMAVLEQAIQEGNTVLFTTSPRLLPASLRAAVEHPEATILNCSLNKSHRYIRTYYARMYEAKFVIGAVAGALAGSDDIGYLCDYPIFGQIAGINAFALGAQLVNPRVKVCLEWSAIGGGKAAMKRLTGRGIRLISSQDLTREGEESRASFGLSLVTDAGQVNLAVPVWQWGAYYESILRSIQNKTFQVEYQESSKALNYYWGMSAGAVELQCSEKIPPSTRKLAELLQESIRADLCYPFRGKLYTQEGRELEGDLSPEEIIGMDWLAENVVGSIPEYAELSAMGKATVDMVGIDRAAKDKKGAV